MDFITLDQEEVTADRIAAGDIISSAEIDWNLVVVQSTTDVSQEVWIYYIRLAGTNKGTRGATTLKKGDTVRRYKL